MRLLLLLLFDPGVGFEEEEAEDAVFDEGEDDEVVAVIVAPGWT